MNFIINRRFVIIKYHFSIFDWQISINEIYSPSQPEKLLHSVLSGPYKNRSAANNAKEQITKSGFDPRLRTLCKKN